MSYCRYSCDDYQCNLYCYETEGGYQTHVAKYKAVFTEPLPPVVAFEADNGKAWFERYKAAMAIVDAAPLVPVGLASDGEDYLDSTLEEFMDTLTRLKAEGYRFPECVFDLVRQEIAVRDVPLPEPEPEEDEEDDEEEDFDMDDEEEDA